MPDCKVQINCPRLALVVVVAQTASSHRAQTKERKSQEHLHILRRAPCRHARHVLLPMCCRLSFAVRRCQVHNSRSAAAEVMRSCADVLFGDALERLRPENGQYQRAGGRGQERLAPRRQLTAPCPTATPWMRRRSSQPTLGAAGGAKVPLARRESSPLR